MPVVIEGSGLACKVSRSHITIIMATVVRLPGIIGSYPMLVIGKK
jgi:hypothetical protein